jgi:hypothetical protein
MSERMIDSSVDRVGEELIRPACRATSMQGITRASSHLWCPTRASRCSWAASAHSAVPGRKLGDVASRSASFQRSNATSVSSGATDQHIPFRRGIERLRVVPHHPPINAHSQVWQTPSGTTTSRNVQDPANSSRLWHAGLHGTPRLFRPKGPSGWPRTPAGGCGSWAEP